MNSQPGEKGPAHDSSPGEFRRAEREAVGSGSAGADPTGRTLMTRRAAGWWTVLVTGLLTSATALVLAGAPQQAPPDFGPGSGVSTDGPVPREGAAAAGSRRPGVPVRLTLRAQKVRADVVPVGTTSAGDLAVPNAAEDVGWYRYGPRPGSRSGSSVLVGHVDSRSGDLGALAALADARAGDPVVIRAAGGTDTHFRITARRSVSRKAFPQDVFRTSGPPELVLVTCAGPYDPERGGYQRLLLVTAVPA